VTSGQPARPQVGRFIGLPQVTVSTPTMTVRSGTQRAAAPYRTRIARPKITPWKVVAV